MKYYVQGTVGKGYSAAIQQALIHENPSTGTPDMPMYSPYLTFNVVHGISPSNPDGLTPFLFHSIHVPCHHYSPGCAHAYITLLWK